MACPDGFIGSVEIWPISWAPDQWAVCNGQLLSINTNQALYSLLGTTFGGDGRSTFGVPNLCGRVPVGVGQRPGSSNYVFGQEGGNETATLNQNNLPAHTHTASGTVTPKAGNGKISLVCDPLNNFPGQTPAATPVYTTTNNVAMGSSPVNVTVQPAGSNQPFSIMPPYLCLNYIIALSGLYPSRP